MEAHDVIGTIAIVADNAQQPGRTFAHFCPALEMNAGIEITSRRAGLADCRFCPYCGLRVGGFGPSWGRGADWECTVVRDLATRWIGRGSESVSIWIGAEGQTNEAFARSQWPLLDYLLTRLEAIAGRRVGRIMRAARAVKIELSAVWHARQLLAVARAKASPQTSSDLVNGFVYAISNGSHLKIGWSARHPELQRVRGLQVGSPQELEVVGAILGTPQDERRVQQRFARHRIRGEWFSDSSEIRRFFIEQSHCGDDRSGSAPGVG